MKIWFQLALWLLKICLKFSTCKEFRARGQIITVHFVLTQIFIFSVRQLYIPILGRNLQNFS